MARTKGALGKKTLIARGILKAENKVTPNKVNGFLYRAASCGCEIVKPMIGCGLTCQHKNSMIRVLTND